MREVLKNLKSFHLEKKMTKNEKRCNGHGGLHAKPPFFCNLKTQVNELEVNENKIIKNFKTFKEF